MLPLQLFLEYVPTMVIVIFNIGLLFIYLRGVLTSDASPASAFAYPPTVPYRIPWIGALFPFAFINPQRYMKHARQRMGPNFRILAAGQSIVVVGTPAGIRAIQCLSPKKIGVVDHQRLGKLVGLSVARTEEIFEIVHRDLFNIITRNFRSQTLPAFTASTATYLWDSLLRTTPLIGTDAYQTIDLVSLVSRVIFGAAVATFWGPAADDILNTFEDMQTFEELVFPLTRGITIGQTTLKRARARVFSAIQSHVRCNWVDTDDGGFLAGASDNISSCLRHLKAKNFSDVETARIMFIIHLGTSHGTLTSVTMWVMMFLISDPVALLRVKDAVRSAYPDPTTSTGTKADQYQELDLQVPILDSAIKETLRLMLLPMTVREALVDLELPGEGCEIIKVLAGEYVLADVHGMHHDPLLHPDPQTFVVDRFLDKAAKYGDFEGAKTLVPWGGGLFMCKGRAYAQRLIKLYFIIFFQLFDIEPVLYPLPETTPWAFTVPQPRTVPTIRIRRRALGGDM